MVGKIRKFKWRLPIISIIGIIVMSLMLLVNDIEAHAGSLYTYYYSGTGFSFATGTSPSGGSGDCFCFTPSKTGVYRIYSSKTAGDPYVILSMDYTTTKSAINSAGKYSYTGAYAGNDDGNGSLNFNIYAYMQKGTTYYIFATRWGSSTANFTTYCSYMGAGTITLNKQSGSGGTSYLYGGRSGYSSVAYPSESYLTYSDTSACTNAISLVSLPTRTGYKFGGYYTSTGGSGTQVIDANGNIKKLALYNAFSGNGTIYAYWIPQNQTYSFNANGGNGGPSNVTVMYGSKLPSINKFPTKTGYTFAGYYTAASGGTQYYGANGVSSITNSASGGTTPLYAHWTANKYNVTFNTNGGTNSTVQSVTYDSTLPTGVIAPSKTGYKFEGYYLDKACTTSKYYNENMNVALSPDKWTIAADTTLYAKWTPIKYNIMLMSDDDVHGSGGSGFVDLLTNVEYGKLELPRAEDKNMSREHYDFVGWNIYDGQDWAMYQPMQIYSTGLTGVAGETVPVYAAWKVKDSYTVAYSSNGGTGAPRSQLVFDTEETWNLEVADETANDLKYPNYSFLGWSVNPSGGFETELNNGYAEPFKKGDKIKVNSSMTLYARWEKNKALAYNANGGILPSVIETTYPAKGSKVPVVLDADRVPTRTGYIFKGWSENPEDTPGNAYFGSNNQYTMTGEKDVTLYAVWDKEQYDVLYNYYYDAETNQDVKDTEKENELAAAGIEIINNDSSVKYMEDCSFTLKYDDRATNVKNLSVKINNIDAFSPAKSENGHEVTLKYTIPKATAKQYVSIEGASRITYGITYVNNGGQVDSLDTDPLVSNYKYASSGNINLIGAPTYNESGVLTKTGIFKTGYVFDGWYTESSFENKVESISKSEAKDVVLYAKWSPIQYSIVYDANSSLVTGNVPESQTGIYDSSVVIQDKGAMVCQRNSKVFPFIGWSTNPQATVADYSEGETVQNLSDINGGVITSNDP